MQELWGLKDGEEWIRVLPSVYDMAITVMTHSSCDCLHRTEGGRLKGRVETSLWKEC